MTADATFRCEVEQANNTDERGNHVTTVKCHGRLVSGTAERIKDVVKPLILSGGRIVVDLGDVSHLDSSGLGTLVSLKASAVNQGLCILEFANMTPRVLEMLRITRLAQMFAA
jgi:anti-anti-sigma factor